MVTSQEREARNAALILSTPKPKNQQSKNKKTSREIMKQQARVADNDCQSENKTWAHERKI